MPENDNNIEGIDINTATDGVYVCYLNNFSDALKEKIRNLLCGIWHGAVNYTENQDIYNYKETLKDFLDRYNTQARDTKKGMIGELLTHVLLPNYLPDFEVVSIMKNPAERKIRTGFDVVYYQKSNPQIWYCEVKSGGDEDSLSVDEKNNERLGAAKTSIKNMFDSRRITLWQSVLDELNLTIFNAEKKVDIKKLLKEDYPIDNSNQNKNVILSSVIYKCLDNKICPENLKRCKDGIDNESIFVGVLIFSIQKKTYTKVEEFLHNEAGISYV